MAPAIAACGSALDGTAGGRGAKRCAMRDAATPSVCGARLPAQALISSRRSHVSGNGASMALVT